MKPARFLLFHIIILDCQNAARVKSGMFKRYALKSHAKVFIPNPKNICQLRCCTLSREMPKVIASASLATSSLMQVRSSIEEQRKKMKSNYCKCDIPESFISPRNYAQIFLFFTTSSMSYKN